MIPTLEWLSQGVNFLDQTKLPLEETYVLATDYKQVASVIRDMIVRGAPAIGVSAAMGMALGIERSAATTLADLTAEVAIIAKTLAETRPTAVNLFWGIDEIRSLYNSLTAKGTPIPKIKSAVIARARQMYDEDIAACKQMGAHGAALLPMEGTVLTHCNAGALATGGIGTALAPIYLAVEQGRRVNVFADETRPLLQGSRLTAWELSQAGIDVTVLADNMAASLMRDRAIDLVIVGADRIAANGDVANKIGTYSLALAARHHGVPFYVAAPWSTVDAATPAGRDIAIEHRDADEIREWCGTRTAPAGVAVYNPAFDVTPAEFISAIITDRGIARPPYCFVADRHAGSGEV